jgi:HAD superfamily phosphatase (TIGR01681 family)
VRILSSEHIDRGSPISSRFDIKSELVAGFPYATAHADVLGEALANLVLPRPRKKGLITDLDDTFWAGIVGEVGPAAVQFDLESGTQIHAIYQQFLASLADAGVLVGVASRNDAEVVQEALSSRDLHIDAARLFPIEAHWGEKSESVRRILQAWNIAPDAVVFVDDSPARARRDRGRVSGHRMSTIHRRKRPWKGDESALGTSGSVWATCHFRGGPAPVGLARDSRNCGADQRYGDKR